MSLKKTMLEQLHIPYLLKEIKRTNKVGERNETSAEHTYSTIMLSEYFLAQHSKINKEKVRTLILYHDLPEVYAGDAFILNDRKREEKEKLENIAAQKLEKELPKEIAKEFAGAWKEYSLNKTIEAKFAHAMDAMDSIIQAIEQPEEWRVHGFTENVLRKYKEKYFVPFPIVLEFFNYTVEELKKKKVIPEEK